MLAAGRKQEVWVSDRHESASVPVPAQYVAPDSRIFARVVLLAVLAVVLAVAYLALQTKLVALGYRADALERGIQKGNVEVDRLELKLAQLEALHNVEQVARSKMGMREPERIAYLHIEPGLHRGDQQGDQLAVGVESPAVERPKAAKNESAAMNVAAWVHRWLPGVLPARARPTEDAIPGS